jgi:hypothetical protein
LVPDFGHVHRTPTNIGTIPGLLFLRTKRSFSLMSEPSTALAPCAPTTADPVPTKGTRLFSGSFAREMAERSRIVREQRKQEADQAKLIVAALKAGAVVEPSETFRLNRLARVRAQLAKVDTEIDDLLDDPKADQSRLKVILEASKALSEQERKLDNRPEPGSFRPANSRTKPKTADTYGPVE